MIAKIREAGSLVKIAFFVGVAVMASGPALLARGETSGVVQTVLALAGTLGWIGLGVGLLLLRGASL